MVELGLFFLGIIAFLAFLGMPILGPCIIFRFNKTAGVIAGIFQLSVFLIIFLTLKHSGWN